MPSERALTSDVVTPPVSTRLHLLVTRDDAETYSAVVLNLPGAGSCGATEDEAVANAKEATRCVIESYEADGVAIPWTAAPVVVPPGAKELWVRLDG